MHVRRSVRHGKRCTASRWRRNIYIETERGREGERERVTPEYLDATRESVELRSRPRDPFSTVLSSSSSCVQLVPVLPRRAFSRFLSRFARPPIYFHFFVVFAYGGRVIMVLYALLDPPSSFLLAKTNLPPPSPRLSLSRLALSYPPRRSFFVRFIRAKRSPRPAETLLLLGL